MSWEKLKVSEICDIVRGSSPRPKGDPQYYGGNIPRLMIEDLTRDGKFVTPRIDFLTEAGAKLSRPMKKGELVITVSGRPGCPAILATDACIHDGFVGFRNLSTNVDTEYLYYYLSFLTEKTNSQSVGAIFKNLTTEQIKNLEISIPPLTIQKHIASTLEKAENVRHKDKLLLQKYDDLAHSIFYVMFGDPMRNDEQNRIPLTDFAVINPSKRELFTIPNKVSFLPMNAVSETGDISPLTRDYTEVSTGFTYFIENDVLFAKITPCMENGKGAIARNLLNMVGFGSTEFHILRPLKPLTSEFIYVLLSLYKVRKKAEENMTGSAGQRRVPKDFFGKLYLPIPDEELIIKFTKSYSNIRKERRNIQECLVRSESLFNCILNRYFS